MCADMRHIGLVVNNTVFRSKGTEFNYQPGHVISSRKNLTDIFSTKKQGKLSDMTCLILCAVYGNFYGNTINTAQG
jgi:hypothetical protein